jgi:hypothetical protein
MLEASRAQEVKRFQVLRLALTIHLMSVPISDTPLDRLANPGADDTSQYSHKVLTGDPYTSTSLSSSMSW